MMNLFFNLPFRFRNIHLQMIMISFVFRNHWRTDWNSQFLYAFYASFRLESWLSFMHYRYCIMQIFNILEICEFNKIHYPWRHRNDHKKVYFFNIFIQSRSAWKRGEIKLAREKSSISKDFIRASVCIGMFMYILILVAVLFIVILHVHSWNTVYTKAVSIIHVQT